MADLTPNNREEYWLKGMVDGQTTLEPNNRREYWCKEIVEAIGSGGGGGTGGGMVVVHGEYNDNDYWVLDKTWNELLSALSDGKLVILSNSVVGAATMKFLSSCSSDSNGYHATFVYADSFTATNTMDFIAETASDYPKAED